MRRAEQWPDRAALSPDQGAMIRARRRPRRRAAFLSMKRAPVRKPERARPFTMSKSLGSEADPLPTISTPEVGISVAISSGDLEVFARADLPESRIHPFTNHSPTDRSGMPPGARARRELFARGMHSSTDWSGNERGELVGRFPRHHRSGAPNSGVLRNNSAHPGESRDPARAAARSCNIFLVQIIDWIPAFAGMSGWASFVRSPE